MDFEAYRKWRIENSRLNALHNLQIGDRVIDSFHWSGKEVCGAVTEIHDWASSGPLTRENHGGVTILLDDGEEEHYCLINWQEHLRIENG